MFYNLSHGGRPWQGVLERDRPIGTIDERLPRRADVTRHVTESRPVSSLGRSSVALNLARAVSGGLLVGFLCAANPSAWAAPALGPGGPLPLAFEPNEGQADPGVKFLARGRGYGLFFTPSETVLVLTPPDARVSGRRPFASPKSSPPSVVRMRLMGAEAAATIAGLDRLLGHTHYLVGEASRWRRDVPTFARIRYSDVYPGVSLVFYGSERQLEYDFIVAPGADPSVVALAFDGADGLRLDEQGDLLITTAAGEVRLRRPAIYQEQDGERRPVDGGYVLDGGRVRFRVAAWDASRPLVIDPVLGYSSYLGGAAVDQGFGVAIDAVGNAYVTGATASTNFPVSATPFQRGRGALTDAFVVKVDPSGVVVYSTYLGGTGDDAALALAVDGSGVAFLTGSTSSTTFPATPGQTLAGLVDAFVTQVGDGGIIQFTGASYQVAENGGSITIGVQRTGDSTALVKVDYLTSDGTATAGANYLPASGTLTFAPGQIVATFTVTILDDTIGEGDQAVHLTRRNAGGGAVLGTRRSATLTIVDNEPAINFSAASYNVPENKGPAVITVARSGPAAGTVTVRFTTSDGPGASAPGRYAAVNTTLTFAPGVRSLKASVPIVNDTLAQGNGIVNLILSNVGGGTPPAQLGVRSSATL